MVTSILWSCSASSGESTNSVDVADATFLHLYHLAQPRVGDWADQAPASWNAFVSRLLWPYFLSLQPLLKSFLLLRIIILDSWCCRNRLGGLKEQKFMVS